MVAGPQDLDRYADLTQAILEGLAVWPNISPILFAKRAKFVDSTLYDGWQNFNYVALCSLS